MRQNESLADRVLRISLSVVPLALGIFSPGSVILRLILVILGTYMLLTGLIGFCPIYALNHFSTKR
jgi:hypothetical protein